jgi:serine/threonine protein kinase
MIGKTILQYNILEKIGDGGMGEVYLAEDTKLKRKVALKFLPKEYSRNPEAKKRFMTEARSASSLDHNNICVIHDINETEDDQMFISMNYCRGGALQNYIKGKDLTLKDILKIIKQIARGLEKAHSKGIVHCDIKPSNIIITDDKVAKIVDFGIAKIASEEKLHSKERTSGTIAYMSPEQVNDSKIDARTDIWSLGVVFYEMLTKQAPFQDSYNEALMYSIINEEPIAIANIKQNIPNQITQIITKLLEKDPDERYQSAKELLADIKRYNRVVDIPINPIKYFKLFFANIKNKRFSLVVSFLLSIFIFSVIYITVIQGSSVPSIGILNMENLGDPEDEFWSRGITEDLIVNVASAGVIRVPTLNEINRYNGAGISIEELAKKLRVDYLLSSSLFKKDSTFDLWCRIIDHKTGKDIFARKWSKPIQEASTITTILAGTVLNNLGISSDKTRAVPVIIDPDAYEYYLKGKNTWEKKTNTNDIEIARALLNKALEIDPNFLLAKMQLGQTFMGPANYTVANRLFSESLLYANKIGDEKSSALAMFHLGNINLHNYKTDEAIKYYNDALKIVRKYDDKFTEIRIIRNIGGYYYYNGDFEQAKRYFIDSRILSGTLDDILGEAEALYNLGSLNLEAREYKSAIEAYQKSYDIFNKLENKSHIVSSSIGLSYGSMGLGKIEEALQFAEASLKAAREISDNRNEIFALSYIGEINYSIGNYDLAFEKFIKVSDLSNNIGENYYSAVSNQFLGQIMFNKKMYDNSIEYYIKADIFWKILNEPTWRVWTSSAWAYASLINGDIDSANKKIKETESILKDVKPYEDYATCVYYNLFNYYKAVGDTTMAMQNLYLANNEMNDRIKFIQNNKNKHNYINKIVNYEEIFNNYKKYFN